MAVYKYALTEEEVVQLARSYGLEPKDPQPAAGAQEGIYQDGTALTLLDQLTFSSSDKKNTVKIWKDEKGIFYYSVSRNGKVVIECSKLGLNTEAVNLTEGMTLDESSVKQTTGTEKYELVQRGRANVNKNYTQLSFDLKKGNSKVTVIFRQFEDGVAYRYEVDADTTKNSEKTVVLNENSEFSLPEDGSIWTIAPSVTYESYQYTQGTVIEQYETSGKYSTPILASLGKDSGNCWVLLSEANVYNEENPFCASYFKTDAGEKSFKTTFGRYLVEETDETKDKKTYSPNYKDIPSVTMEDVFHMPWRVAVLSDDLNGIANSTLISDLNPEAKGDFSWVQPGTSVWSWWSTSYDAIEYSTMIDYIDFCSECGITYCLVDYGWELWDNYKEKIASLVEYAESKNVGILVWYGVNKFDASHIFDLDNKEEIEEQFAWCEEVGVKGVKVDYINSDSPFAMQVMYYLADIAAKHHLVLNYHGCTNPNGENRTYPNILSSEAVAGMENYKWSNGSSIETLLTLPYTRNVLGSMEFTPTAYRVKSSPATSGFMLAMSVAYESAVQTFAQSAYVYPGYAGLSLLADVPSSWEESRLLMGYPGKNVVEARRSGEDWYIGAMTASAETYEIPLDFLDKNTVYNAHLYKDNEDGSGIEIETQQVTAGSVLDVSLLENGGCAIKITKDELRTTVYDNYRYYEAEDPEYATCTGNAAVAEGPYASNLSYVGNVGKAGNALTFHNINAKKAGEYELKIYYISGAKRNLYVKVNDNEPIELKDLIGNMNDWSAVGGVSLTVQLEEGENEIMLYHDTADAPNIDRIAVEKFDISMAEATLEKESYEYSNTACKPAVTLKLSGVDLVEGEDYTVSYRNNINAGTAKVIIRGINGCSGTITKTFTIKEVNNKPQSSQTKKNSAISLKKTEFKKTAGDKPFSLNAKKTAGNGAMAYVSSNKKVAVVDKNGKVSIKGAGICTIQISVKETESYKSAKKTVTIKVAPKAVAKLKAKKTAKSTMTVTWKKDASVSGYELEYSTSSRFKKSQTKTILIKKAKETSKKFKIKKDKKYYIRIRSFKSVKVNGKSQKLYSAYSKVKK